jgi:hypothetical protein
LRQLGIWEENNNGRGYEFEDYVTTACQVSTVKSSRGGLPFLAKTNADQSILVRYPKSTDPRCSVRSHSTYSSSLILNLL